MSPLEKRARRRPRAAILTAHEASQRGRVCLRRRAGLRRTRQARREGRLEDSRGTGSRSRRRRRRQRAHRRDRRRARRRGRLRSDAVDVLGFLATIFLGAFRSGFTDLLGGSIAQRPRLESDEHGITDTLQDPALGEPRDVIANRRAGETRLLGEHVVGGAVVLDDDRENIVHSCGQLARSFLKDGRLARFVPLAEHFTPPARALEVPGRRSGTRRRRALRRRAGSVGSGHSRRISRSSVGSTGTTPVSTGVDAWATVPVRVVLRIGEIEVFAGGTPALDAEAAVAGETAVGNIVLVSEDASEVVGDVGAATLARRLPFRAVPNDAHHADHPEIRRAD